MSEKGNEYEANYSSALSFLKLALKEQAFDCLERAYLQVPDEKKNLQNTVYLDILDNLAILSLERGDRGKTIEFVEEGLSVKDDHADLLFLKSLLLMDEKRYDEMLEALIHYFLSMAEEDASLYNYKYIHEVAIKEVYENLLPTAYRYAFQHEQIREIVQRMSETTKNQWLMKAHEVMIKIDALRNEREN